MSVANPSDEIACHGCGLTVELPALEEGERAECPRCGSKLAKRCYGDWQRVGALSLGALVALLVSLAYPFLALQSAGGDRVMTVWGAAWEVLRERPLLGVVVAVFFVVFPLAQTLAMAGVAIGFLSGRVGRGWRWLLVTVERLQPWSMADVFLVGTLVSLIKVASLARLEFGVAFWSFAVFVILFAAAYSSLDTQRALRELESRMKVEG